MFNRNAKKLLKLFFALIVLSVFSGNSCAEIVDDIYLKAGADGDVDAIIKFSVPVIHLRHFPHGQATYLEIYFKILGDIPNDQWQDYETHRSPPSDRIAGFTVSTRDLTAGPKIQIQFKRPTEFTVNEGKDGRSLIIHITPDRLEPKKEISPATSLPPSVINPAVVLPGALAATAIPNPGATSHPAVSQAQTPLLTGLEVKALPGQPSLQPGALRTPFDGKDGLPAYPIIEPASNATVSSKQSDGTSLEELTKLANSQAAALMLKGRDALSAGEMFSAVDSYNKTLNLPPNKYTEDAQIWIGIARQKAGQSSKAKLEFESYLKLYPNGKHAQWVKERVSLLSAMMPAATAKVQGTVAKVQPTEFQTTEYGNLAMYYYHGSSNISSNPTGNLTTSRTVTDQSSLVSNLSLTARSHNNEFDNRLTLQDFNAANFLPGQKSTNRLNAFYFEIKNRIDNYSARVGRQSSSGGGVMGRFDGISAGYGFSQNLRTNAAIGRLSESVVGSTPIFVSGSMDFGVRSPLGGTIYFISQKAGGMTDRLATGGNLRYFDQGKTAMSMWDYDLQFKALNSLTLQGTLNVDGGTDFNFVLDRRRSPSLSIRNAVSGSTSTVDVLLQNGWTKDDLILLAQKRTAISNMAQAGMTNRFNEKWQAGTDFVISKVSGMPESGTNPDLIGGGTPLEGFVPATPSTGYTWSVNERLSATNIFSSNDISMCSFSFSKSHTTIGKTLILNSRTFSQEVWTLDSTWRMNWQNDNQVGKQTDMSPSFRLGYRLKSNLSIDTEGGLDWAKSASSKTTRKYFSVGFRWDF